MLQMLLQWVFLQGFPAGFSAADNLDNEKWEPRSLSNNLNLLEKDRIARFAIELAEKIN